jgi:hypothetical protein
MDPAAKRDNLPLDPVWEAASSAPVESEDPGEHRLVEQAREAHAIPVSGEEVSAQIAERVRHES